MLDLDFDDAQLAIADAVDKFCAERCGEEALRAAAGGFPAELWTELAGLGVFAVATPEGGGGALEIVAAMESLGRAGFPGPLDATFFAREVLPDAEAAAVAKGECVVSLGAPPLWPWGPVADVFLEVDAGGVRRARLREPVEAVETLGGEPWARAGHERGEALAVPARAFALLDAARAAYQAAAGRRLVDDAAEHARTRRQFGRSLGEFQAVSHPLADCAISLAGAASLARGAAFCIDEDAPDARARAAAARLTADRAALRAVAVAHQTFGALGATRDGPAFLRSRRIRQIASLPPGPDAGREALLGCFEAASTAPAGGSA